MSLMDDIFDVREALEKLPERPAFDRIEQRLWDYEEIVDKHTRLLTRIDDMQRALNDIKAHANNAG